MFNLAFENQHESGYVTEKPFDALIAGTVPVYKGDSAHLKSLLPHPDAAIFLDDFKDVKSLVAYLNHLSQNETAYERHRAWRHDYTFEGVRHVTNITNVTNVMNITNVTNTTLPCNTPRHVSSTPHCAAITHLL